MEIEHRLAERKATSQEIRKLIDRDAAGGAIRRIEIRLSTQCAEPIVPGALREMLGQLLHQHGLDGVELSLRFHDQPLDDALGEHLVRIYRAEDSADTDITPTRHWHIRLRDWWHRRGRAPSVLAPARHVEPSCATAPALRPDEAARMLRIALHNAMTLAAPYDASGQALPIAQINIVARRPDIDAALRPMLPPAQMRAGAALARLLREQGGIVVDAPHISYRFEPYPSSELGTSLVIGGDLECKLSSVADDPFSATADEPDGTALPLDAGTAFTALPRHLAATAPARLCIRVRGTLDEDFVRPFDLRYAVLPAGFDRATLQRAGFARHHPHLLAVASQSCRLRIETSTTGAMLHTLPCVGRAPMYYRRDTLAPLAATQILDRAPLALVVNAPQGVILPDGRPQAPLVIELTLDPGPADPQAISIQANAAPPGELAA